MKINLIAFLILIAVTIPVDRYIGHAVRRYTRHRWVIWLHRGFCGIALLSLIPVIITDISRSSNQFFILQMWMMMTYLSITLCQIFFVITDLISRIPQRRGKKPIRWLSITGAAVSCLGFAAIWWGALFNRFDIEVNEVTVEIPGLPPAFEGYRIAHISDLHVGTNYPDTTFISRVVDSVTVHRPDLIAFTGDMVNRNSSEIVPYIPTLSRLKAPDGLYAVFGNHDFCGYYKFFNELMRWYDTDQLRHMMAEAGFDFLRNEYRTIRHNGDSIILIGINYMSDEPDKYRPYLEESYPTLDDSVTKILMSHNPRQWSAYVADNPGYNIPLTLSGHTHAMQMKIGGFSPSAIANKAWGGLSSDRSGLHQIYVNIGIGSVGMPSRIGANPEVTIITLKRKQ